MEKIKLLRVPYGRAGRKVADPQALAWEEEGPTRLETYIIGADSQEGQCRLIGWEYVPNRKDREQQSHRWMQKRPPVVNWWYDYPSPDEAIQWHLRGKWQWKQFHSLDDAAVFALRRVILGTAFFQKQPERSKKFGTDLTDAYEEAQEDSAGEAEDPASTTVGAIPSSQP